VDGRRRTGARHGLAAGPFRKTISPLPTQNVGLVHDSGELRHAAGAGEREHSLGVETHYHPFTRTASRAEEQSHVGRRNCKVRRGYHRWQTAAIGWPPARRFGRPRAAHVFIMTSARDNALLGQTVTASGDVANLADLEKS